VINFAFLKVTSIPSIITLDEVAGSKGIFILFLERRVYFRFDFASIIVEIEFKFEN